MKRIKNNLIMIITIFVLSVLYHYVYDKIKIPFTKIYFPVDESIWQHMKLIYSSTITYGIITYFTKKRLINNHFLVYILLAILSIPIYLIMFLPIYYLFGENLIVSIALMVIDIVILVYIKDYYKKYPKLKFGNLYALFLFIISSVMFYITTK